MSGDLRGRILELYDAYLAADGKAVDYDGMRGDPRFDAYVDATVELTKVDISQLQREGAPPPHAICSSSPHGQAQPCQELEVLSTSAYCHLPLPLQILLFRRQHRRGLVITLPRILLRLQPSAPPLTPIRRAFEFRHMAATQHAMNLAHDPPLFHESLSGTPAPPLCRAATHAVRHPMRCLLCAVLCTHCWRTFPWATHRVSW